MALFASVPLIEIKARGSIKDGDVAKLSKNFSEDPFLSETDADQLLSLNDSCAIQDPAWQACFVELMTEFIVEQTEPYGYINAQKARWVRDRLSRFGKVEFKTKLDLLVAVIAKSRWVPQSLVVFALDQVRIAILDGAGPLRAGKLFEPGAVADTDVHLLREILLAFGGEGNDCVTQGEAEMLLSIDLMTQHAANAPGWRELFVGALSCAVMGASGYALASREMALTADRFAERRDIDNLLSGMVCGDGALLQDFTPLAREQLALRRLTQQKVAIVTREEIPALDAGWLVQHFSIDAHRTPNVLAVLRLLKAENRPLDPGLEALVQRIVSVAA